MNSTNGELLKEVLVLEECLGNPKVAEKVAAGCFEAPLAADPHRALSSGRSAS